MNWLWIGYKFIELGNRKRGRLFNSCRRDIGCIVQLKGFFWMLMEFLVRDGGELRSFVGGLCFEIKQIGFSDWIGFYNRKVLRNFKILGVIVICV